MHVKYVRREIRELTAEDRERYLGAVQVIYNTDTAAGQQLYGSAYRGSEWLVREHLYGAASKMCDHWHDDAGFLNHHHCRPGLGSAPRPPLYDPPSPREPRAPPEKQKPTKHRL